MIYFGNVLAGLLAPTLFLHFCLTFPEPRQWFRSSLRVGAAVPAGRGVLPASIWRLLSGALRIAVPLVECAGCWTGLAGLPGPLPYLAGGLVLACRVPPQPKTRSCASS